MNSNSSSLTSPGPLNDTGVDFSNETQAANFLSEILDDSDLQITANQYARDFWYGAVVFIAIFALFNIIQATTVRLRHVLPMQNSG
jgi:ferric-chelate reductase